MVGRCSHEVKVTTLFVKCHFLDDIHRSIGNTLPLLAVGRNTVDVSPTVAFTGEGEIFYGFVVTGQEMDVIVSFHPGRVCIGA